MIIAIHPVLQPYAGVNWISRLDTHVKQVMKELATLDASDVIVDVKTDSDSSLAHQLFTYRPSFEANQWVYISGRACGRDFQLTLPFRYGVRQPYQLQIILKSNIDMTANLWPGVFSSRGNWYTDPLDRRKGKALRALRLPGVGWTHHASSLKIHLKFGGHILPPDEECLTNRWIVVSAYQGMILVRPKIAKYLRDANRLDLLLQTMSSS